MGLAENPSYLGVCTENTVVALRNAGLEDVSWLGVGSRTRPYLRRTNEHSWHAGDPYGGSAATDFGRRLRRRPARTRAGWGGACHVRAIDGGARPDYRH